MDDALDPIDPALVVATAAVVGAVAVVAPWPAALVAACSVVALQLGRRTCARLAWVLAVVAAVASFARASAAIDGELSRWERTTASVPRPSRCVVHGWVSTMPIQRGVVRADVRADRLECDERAIELTEPVVVRLYEVPDTIARGDEVEAVAQLAPARRARNPDLGDERPMLARRGVVLSGSALAFDVVRAGRGVTSAIDRARSALRRGLVAVVSPEVAPIARALVLGEEDLDPDDDEAFRTSGLMHLLAVSGSHVALVVGGLVEVVRRLLLRATPLARRCDVARLASALGVPLALVYEQLAGDSGSARRATAMAIVLLVARAFGRRPDLPRALALSALAALGVDPLSPFDLSFALSLAATVGLITLAPAIAARIPRLPRLLRSALSATVAASLACAPLVATLSGALPVLGVVANAVAVPLGELAALPLANVAALLGVVRAASPKVGLVATGIGRATDGALVLLRGVARIASAPSWAKLHVPPPTPMQTAVVVSAAIVIYVVGARGRRALGIALCALAGCALLERIEIHRGAPHGVMRVTVLDVGQGDSSLVDLPDGRVLLIDGGGEVGSPYDPGRAVVAPVLAARRRRRVDVAILTHPHPDHFLGLAGALRDVDVGALWDTGEGEAEGAGASYAALLGGLRARRVPIVRPSSLCGGERAFGGIALEVLAPCPRFDPDASANDNSFVIRLGYGSRHVLLVGDAEHAEESRLLERDPSRLAADFLKIGHHGSRTSSSPDFLRAVSPTFAAISCGLRNRFGHPHPSTLEALAGQGARVFRTDHDGAIRFTTDGTSTEVATARAGW